MDSGFDLDVSSKSQPKKGRRARGSEEQSDKSATLDDTSSEQIRDGPARPPRRQTGWNTSKTALNEDVFDSRLLANESEKSSDDEIQMIPDLDELNDDDITQEIANAPIVSSDIATFKELDVDLMNRSAFRTLDGNIDLKVLIKNLSSEQEVREEKDAGWEWSKLFTEVSAALKASPDAHIIKPVQEQEVS